MLIFRGRKKVYKENQLHELDPKKFFIEFGFKTKKYGKEFMIAVNDVYRSTEKTAFKDFLYK